MIPPLDPARDGWPNGHDSLVLLGPPGCGKTRSVLDAWLVPALRAGVHPFDILACSFTRTAASEIAHRLSRALDMDVDRLRQTCRTIHSETWARVREAPGRRLRPIEQKKLQPDDAEGEEDEPREKKEKPSALRAAACTVWDFARVTLEGRGRPIRERLELVRWRFESDRRVAQYATDRLASEVEEYEASKERTGLIDFTDMIERALCYEPRELELLLVDEAQDLAPLQWEFVRHYMQAARRVVLIGDPDQSVHVWCGADPRPLLFYAQDATWTVRRLAKSWRVPRAAHRLARDLILQDHERLDAPYDPADREGSVADVSRLEAREALEAVARQGRPSPAEPGALVLARAAKQLARAGAELATTGVPYLSERGYSPLGAPTALAISRALLGLAAGGARVVDVRALLKALPARGHFPSRCKEKIREEANTWPDDALVSAETLEALGVAARTVLGRPFVDALRLLLDERRPKAGRDRAAELDLLVERWGAEVLERAPAIVLTTLHASKGREAELVVIDMTMPRPTIQAIERGEAEVEERRLLYVGLTRTKDRLLLLRAAAQIDLGHALGLAGVLRAEPAMGAA